MTVGGPAQEFLSVFRVATSFFSFRKFQLECSLSKLET
jgi:hypothetical protein